MKGETIMRRELTLALFGLALLVLLQCPILPAQTEDAKPISKTSDLSIPTCDSLKNPDPGESSTDAANRHKAWWYCLEKGEGTGETLSEGVLASTNGNNGLVVAGAVPHLVDSQSTPVTGTGIEVRSASPIPQPFTFTVGSGPWRKVISVNQVLRDGHRFLASLGLTHKTPQPSIQ
jgi:hypothetical protein